MSSWISKLLTQHPLFDASTSKPKLKSANSRKHSELWVDVVGVRTFTHRFDDEVNLYDTSDIASDTRLSEDITTMSREREIYWIAESLQRGAGMVSRPLKARERKDV